ncbi:PREDICTED: probable dolichyl pyrophosphate Man9GlcNAc2 alpha-1,3-glucosyltransferase [Ipomoea nil]|uniref:probable dolichyl pyrophosphate Man9GlcNAc2 alpha-1,3-glucosyltransferase n=1 Tax=Ipomoea nil TaxID=35883 RepID=UPI00090132A6|nr:PREDICTED: probable dolichyl pyrophosphate Man9GlcNAc2 alpha-1,3-glucosyltransferase [Ipomoea nil]
MEKKPSSDDSDSDSSIWGWIVLKGTAASFLCISLFALLVRIAVSLHSYSGAGTPPRYGDYEAQRHWMEITINLPVKEWYRNSTMNDLMYWGLDYPPLTAYQSYIHGLFLRFFDPQSVALYTSRGYESYIGKLLMRWTVLSSDALIFFPAVLYFINVYYYGKPVRRKSSLAWHIAMLLLNPCLILIDHGHFQYNCISLGLTMAAISAIFSDRDLVSSVLFILALNHKQMSAYFAPAFFSYLFGKCLRQRNPLLEISKLGLVVLGTMAVIWWPYLYSKEASLEVLSRLAPFERGIYEDYVANFWCTSSVLVKWKILFSSQALRLISLAATISSCIPSMMMLILVPSKQNFLYGLLSSALSFYLFSFQVHEKSILLPLLPASILAWEKPFIFHWLTSFAMVSMFPLLRRDQLILPYGALYGLFVILYYAPGGKLHRSEANTFYATLKSLLLACSLILHIVYLMVTPPNRYPFLFEAIIMLLCFSQFVFIFVYSNTIQYTMLKLNSQLDNDKKNL